jgi:hydrogenase nickel incorporation protein HypA/HybF
MHEIKIAEDLSAIVSEAAGKENLSKVTKVNICFGQMIQIVPEIFEFAFRETVRDSIAAEAELNIEIIPVKMKCTRCGNDFKVTENSFSCNTCNSTDLEIINGKELFIKSIEGEQIWK